MQKYAVTTYSLKKETFWRECSTLRNDLVSLDM